MIVEQVDAAGVAAFEPKHDTPISRNCYRPESSKIALERSIFGALSMNCMAPVLSSYSRRGTAGGCCRVAQPRSNGSSRAWKRHWRSAIWTCPVFGWQRHAAKLPRRLRRPQPGLFGFFLHRREALERNVLVLGKIFGIGLERQHVRFDERADALA
jgi:hypothetical protein